MYKERWNRIKGTISYDLAIIIPAYNEEGRLPKALDDFIKLIKGRSEQRIQIIVVDDGSQDGTVKLVNSYKKRYTQYAIELIQQNRNYGKGKAVQTGVLASRAKHILFADADGSTPVSELKRLEAAIANGADIAIGSRAKPSDITRIKTAWHRKFLGRCFNFFVNKFLLPDLHDTQCGFKLFTAEAAHKTFFLQTLEGFGFDLEILYIAKKLGIAVEEVPVNWVNVPGSKVNLVLDAIQMFENIFTIKKTHQSLTRE